MKRFCITCLIAVVAMPFWAQAPNTYPALDSVPDWYVAPVIPINARAPQRTAATNCLVDSVLTYNVDSILVEGTYYDYDQAGRTICTTIWSYLTDGSRVGQSKKEFRFDAKGTQIYTAIYEWNYTTHDWYGTSRLEYTYNEAEQMTSNTIYAWVNNTWVADNKYTWAYDASGREREYIYYARDAITNELVPANGHIQTWYNDAKKTLDVTYTAYSNGAWSAGTKYVWAYDAAENVIEYIYYSALSNGIWGGSGSTYERWTYADGRKTYYEKKIWSAGDWVGESKETWTFNASGKQTLHEQYTWATSDWAITLQEKFGYDAAGNNTLIENYTISDNVWTGTKKEEYTFNASNKKTSTIIYTWSTDDWVGDSKETWTFNASGKQTLHEQYTWATSDWAITLQEKSGYDAAGNNTLIENYTISDNVWTGTKKEEYTFNASNKKTSTIIYAWSAGDWVGESKETWTFNASGKQTLHEQYTWATSDWAITLQEKFGYDAAGNNTLIENYTISDNVWTGTKKEEYTYNSAQKKTCTIISKWVDSAWIYDTKTEAAYQTGNTQVSEAKYTWDGTAWVGSGNKTETTTSGGKTSLIMVYVWSATAGNWVYGARRTYAYDAKGRTIGDTTQQYVNTQWVNYALQTHGFDAKDNDTLAITANWNGTEWVPTLIKKGTFIYTSSGDPILIETYSGLEGAWVGTMKVEGTYNDAGYQTLYQSYDWKNGGWANKSRTIQTYDANNHQLLRQTQNWANNTWTNFSKYEYTYDAAGNTTMEAQYDGSGTAWVGSSKWERQYDEKKRTILYIRYAWRSNKWRGSTRQTFVYDEKDRPLEKIQYSYKNNDWVLSERTTYAYDKRDQTISTRQYWWDGSTWIVYVINDTEYDAADNKVRRHMEGSWYDGELESYVDERYFYACDYEHFTVHFANYDGTPLASYDVVEGRKPVYIDAEPTKPDTDDYFYIFAGWTPEIVAATGEATYTATFTEISKQYTITFKDDEGNTIDAVQVAYGAIPTHEDATKPNTEEYTYTFTGWTPDFVAATADATYTATFTSVKNAYTISFVNYNGTILQSSNYIYGDTPVYEGDTPVRPANDSMTYTFKGWKPAIAEVTAAATYTAEYDSTAVLYTITFANYNGTTLQSSGYAYGATPAYTGERPTKPATAQYTYSFKGWTPAIAEVTSAATYTAEYDSTAMLYTITFANYNGTELQKTEYTYGATPAYTGETPTKPATAQYTYSFKGWTPAIAEVTAAATYTAEYDSTAMLYTITFANYNGTTLQSSDYTYGSTPTYTGETPTKPATAQYTYSFKGWTPAIAEITAAATYTAEYDSTAVLYTVTFANNNGTTLQSSDYAYGATPAYTGETPTKPATAQYTYSFKGWTPAIAEVTATATYTAEYDSTAVLYTITFANYNGTTLQSSDYAYGATPAYTGETPTKPATAQYTYSFKGWTPAIAEVTGVATYTADYDSILVKYFVSFVNYNGTELQKTEYAYGTTPTYTGETPAKPATAQYTYTFKTWEPAIEPVTEATTYTAKFDSIVNAYAITFVNYDGTVLYSAVLAYGKIPTYEGAKPTKPATAQYTYSFKGWTPEIVAITQAATYKAEYDSTEVLYTVTFQNYDGKVLQSQNYTYGATPQYTGITPSRASNKEYAYTFKAWEPKIVPVTQNAVYTATYDSTEIESYVTILFLNYDSTLIYSQVVRYKRMPVYEGPTPTRKPSAHYTYTFKSWSPAISVALENTIYIAQYDSLTRYYSIRFVDYDGTILQSDELLYGETPFYRGAEPTREEDSEYTYTFDGWTPKIAPVDEDVAYVATYKAEPRNTADHHPYADGPDESQPMYNILGNPVDSHYRGIVIQGGRKFLR